jgi:hypothetical protein
MRVTGAKSRSQLNGRFLISVALIVMLPCGTKSQVWPSGAACATAWMPMLPAPPGRFSTTALWPLFC